MASFKAVFSVKFRQEGGDETKARPSRAAWQEA